MPHQPPAACPGPGQGHRSSGSAQQTRGTLHPVPSILPPEEEAAPDYVTQMNDDGKEGVWLLVTAHCRVRGRAPRVLCLGRAKHESDNSAFLLPRLYSPAFTQSTLVTAPLPACCRSERGKRGGSSDNYLHLAAQEIWDLQAAKKRGCSPRSEIIYSSSVTNLEIH